MHKNHRKRFNKNIDIICAIGIFCLLTLTACSEKPTVITVGVSQWVANEEFNRNIEGFKAGMAEDGYEEDVNVRYIIENPNADVGKQREIIQSFIDKKVDLIYSLTTPGTLIAKELVKEAPIVFSIVTFPVEADLVDSLESSKNNLVGTRNYVLPARQYYMFEQLFSETKTLAFVHRKGEPNSAIQYREFKSHLAKRKIEVLDIAAVSLDDMREQLEAKKEMIDSLYAACDTLIQSGGEEVIIEFSRRYKKPIFTCNKDGVFKGALIGNVADFYSIGKNSGSKAALILKGAQPTQILTESPRDDYIILNAKTANELGIDIPQRMLDKAEEVVGE